VVLPAHDEDLVVGLLSGRIFNRLQSDVVIRVGRIPVQSIGDGSLGYASADDIRPVCGLLAVNDQPVVNGSVGTDDDVVGADHVTIAGRDFGGDSVDDFFRVHARIDLAAVAQNRAGETLQVFERVKRRLARKPQRDTSVPEIQRRPLDQLSVRKAGAVSSLELVFELLSLAVATEKEISVDTLEIALDVFH
jgi:hypothetical protein